MNTFASGPKRHYYGKGDVIAYRLNRGSPLPAGRGPVFGASVLMLIYGEAFWATYTTGDNTALIATDSMKNFIQRETMNFEGDDLEGYCRFLADKFLGKYPQVEGIQVSADEIPYESIDGVAAFAPSGPERAGSVGAILVFLLVCSADGNGGISREEKGDAPLHIAAIPA